MGLSLAGQSRSPVRQANGGREMGVNKRVGGVSPNSTGYDVGKPNPLVFSAISGCSQMGNAVKHFRALYKACEQKMVTRRVSEGCTSAGAESQFIPR